MNCICAISLRQTNAAPRGDGSTTGRYRVDVRRRTATSGKKLGTIPPVPSWPKRATDVFRGHYLEISAHRNKRNGSLVLVGMEVLEQNMRRGTAVQLLKKLRWRQRLPQNSQQAAPSEATPLMPPYHSCFVQAPPWKSCLFGS